MAGQNDTGPHQRDCHSAGLGGHRLSRRSKLSFADARVGNPAVGPGTRSLIVTIFEATPLLGGSLDGAGDPDAGCTLRGGRMLTSDNDASGLGSMTRAPDKKGKADSTSWALWEKLAQGRPDFGNPAPFNSCIPQSAWQSFTVSLKTPAFFDAMQTFSDNAAGTGGLVTFKDSNGLMSIALAHQPHFAAQPAGVQVFWGNALLTDRIGDFVAKAMNDCTGAEILHELAGDLRLDPATLAGASCIPCRMAYITAQSRP